MNTAIASIETGETRDRQGTRAAFPALLGLVAALVLGAAGCASKDTSRSGLLEPYRTDLPQGNYLTREQVDQVRPGMSRDQVRFILGTPLLGHVFVTNRWDYVFMFRHPSGQTELRRVTVNFDNDRVASIEADPLPMREDASDPALPGYRPGTAPEFAPAFTSTSESGPSPAAAAATESSSAPTSGPATESAPGSSAMPEALPMPGASPAPSAPTANPTASPIPARVPGAEIDTDRGRVEGNLNR